MFLELGSVAVMAVAAVASTSEAAASTEASQGAEFGVTQNESAAVDFAHRKLTALQTGAAPPTETGRAEPPPSQTSDEEEKDEPVSAAPGVVPKPTVTPTRAKPKDDKKADAKKKETPGAAELPSESVPVVAENPITAPPVVPVAPPSEAGKVAPSAEKESVVASSLVVVSAPVPAAEAVSAPVPVPEVASASNAPSVNAAFAPPLPLPADARTDRPSASSSKAKEGHLDLPPGAIRQPGGLSLSIGGGVSIGQSTFQVGGYAPNRLVSWSGNLGLGYRLPGSVRVGLRTSVRQELTLAGGADDPQTLILGNTGVSVARSIYNFEDGPRVRGSFSATIPTSTASRTASLVTSLSGRVGATQPIGGVFVTLGTSYRKNFHRYTHPLRNADGGRYDPELGDRPARASTGGVRAPKPGGQLVDPATGLPSLEGNAQIDTDTLVNGAVNNTSMSWRNSLSAFYPVPSLAGLGLAISYGLGHSWTYESFELDELSGVGAQEGRGQRNSQTGSLSAMYQVDNVSMSAGMATGGSTRSSDDKRIRFPFFNFDGPESNRTTFFFGLTLTESIPL